MKTFKISIVNKRYNILLTEFDCVNPEKHYGQFSTFDESLETTENDQYNLKFSIAGFSQERNSVKKNYFIDLLTIGTKLKLEIDNTTIINLVIKSITPQLSKNNVVYEYNAQDELSYIWARHNVGYNFSTEELGVLNIYDIAKIVLKDNYFDGIWTVITNPNDLELNSKKITLEITGSNPYNVIIEACNILNCYMRVNYKQKYITFYQKDKVKFSGYRYRPEKNLKELSVSFNGDNFTTILHSFGGQDEYSQNISLVPAIPIAIQTWLIEFRENNQYKDRDKTSKVLEIGNWINLSSFPVDWYSQIRIFILEYDKITPDETKHYKYLTNNTPEELKEIENFCMIADKIPHLGQFICDFDYFLNNKLLSKEDFDIIQTKFNNNMRKNNIMLKIYNPIKYRIEWEIAEFENAIYNMAQQYIVENQNLEQRVKDSQLANATNAFTTIRKQLEEIPTQMESIINSVRNNNYKYFNNLYMLFGKPTENTQNIAATELLPERIAGKVYYATIDKYYTEYKKYDKLLVEATTQLENINKQIAEATTSSKDMPYLDSLLIQLQQQKALLEKRINIYKTLGSGWDTQLWEGMAESWHVDGLNKYLYELLDKELQLWYSSLPKDTKIINITELIQGYENNNNSIWKFLYNNYSDFFYEAKYENTDELNSVSLYNQAITYFNNQNKPAANYNIQILDLSVLEQIDIPRLKVGSKIKVYNEYLNLNDGSNTETPALNNIQYTSNELLVTGITCDLRSPESISLTVQNIQSYESIIEKLLLSIRK